VERDRVSPKENIVRKKREKNPGTLSKKLLRLTVFRERKIGGEVCFSQAKTKGPLRKEKPKKKNFLFKRKRSKWEGVHDVFDYPSRRGEANRQNTCGLSNEAASL